MLRHNMHGEEEDDSLHQPKRMEQAPAPCFGQEEERVAAARGNSGRTTEKGKMNVYVLLERIQFSFLFVGFII